MDRSVGSNYPHRNLFKSSPPPIGPQWKTLVSRLTSWGYGSASCGPLVSFRLVEEAISSLPRGPDSQSTRHLVLVNGNWPTTFSTGISVSPSVGVLALRSPPLHLLTSVLFGFPPPACMLQRSSETKFSWLRLQLPQPSLVATWLWNMQIFGFGYFPLGLCNFK